MCMTEGCDIVRSKYDDGLSPFLVIGGDMKTYVNTMIVKNKATWDEWLEFGEKYVPGAEKIYANEHLVGLIFKDGVVPPGWTHRKKDPLGVVVPKLQTVLRKKFDRLPRMLDSTDFTHMISCPVVSMGDRILLASFEQIGNFLVVWIPTKSLDMGYVPPGDVKKLCMSEYCALMVADVGVKK